MKQKMQNYSLQQLFIKGNPPKNLDGFYKGTLDMLIPKNLLEQIEEFVAKIWLPWYGKQFNKKTNSGDNLLPEVLQPLLRSKYGNKTFGKKDGNRIHAFPFKTKITKALQDPMQVLQLNYNLPQNPGKVRDIIDELVQIDKNTYLGKAYLKEKNGFRLIAFFSLRK